MIAPGLARVNRLFPIVVAPKLLGVSVTEGPVFPLTEVTEFGVANSIQLLSVDAGVALKTKFLFTSVLIAMLPTTALLKANIAV